MSHMQAVKPANSTNVPVSRIFVCLHGVSISRNNNSAADTAVAANPRGVPANRSAVHSY